ncbi:hypothetical protein IWW45_007374 [Coemansia sp. RSA 485]|nr:hypothetical protein IWW45_007374 [Coemansia sp. RSA 485]
MARKLNLLVLVALALHANYTGADSSSDDKKGAITVDIDNGAESKVVLPDFSPYAVPEAALWEQFGDGADARWKRSDAVKDGEEKARYDGEWAIEQPSVLAGIAGDKALVVKTPAHHHAISARLDSPFDPAKNGLVLQYEVKLQDDLKCGGAYIKLLTAPSSGEFSDQTPYTLMFGPDKCGDGKVHLIFRHRSPVTGEYTEHHLEQPPTPPVDGLTHQYTLVINNDNSFTLSIDGTERRSGSLLTDFAPPVNPPKEIADPNDKKPEDWEDKEKIPDPDATKPEDWNEDAPLMVPDEDAVIPDGWLLDEPLLVADPKAEKPADWDDEEDGDWSAPQVPNPLCEDAPGCGPWERPLKRNPEFVGKWNAPLIDNPRYKGEWAPQQISNPEYFEDKSLYKLTKIDAVGFELWTMQAGITFDNIYLGDSADAASRISDNVWKPKHDSELAVNQAMRPKEPPKPKLGFSDIPALLKTRLEEIFFSIIDFYTAAQSVGVAAALKQESSGAFAAAMVAAAVGWVSWNILLFARFLLGMGGVSGPQVEAASAKISEKKTDGDSNEASGTSTGASTSTSTAKEGKAVKRK